MTKILPLAGNPAADGDTLLFDEDTGTWRAAPPPGSGTSGSSNLLVVSGSVTLDDGVDVGTLVGYRATASTTFTGQGGSVTLAAGAHIFERVTGGWTYRTIDEGTGLTPPAPDTTAPTAGTLAVTGVTHNAATLTVSGASDNQGLHGAPYAFSTNNGSTWTGWQSSNVYTATALTAETSYQGRHKVRDTSGNEATGTAQSFTTAAAPVVTPAYTTEVQADNPLVYIPLTETALPYVDTQGVATVGPRESSSYSPQPSAQAIGSFPRSALYDTQTGSGYQAALTAGDPVALRGLTAFTVEALIKPSALASSSFIFSYGYDTSPRVALRLHTNGNISSLLNTVTANSANSLFVVGSEYHVAVTYDGSTLTVYRNGVSVATASLSGATTGGASPSQHYWALGHQAMSPTAGGASLFKGHMAGFAVHGTALSAARILAHAQAAGVAA